MSYFSQLITMRLKEVDMMLKRLCSLIALAPLALASFAGMPAEARDYQEPEGPEQELFAALAEPDLDAVLDYADREDDAAAMEKQTGEAEKDDSRPDVENAGKDKKEEDDRTEPAGCTQNGAQESGSPVRSHGIDVSGVGPEWKFALTPSFLDQIRAGSGYLYYSGSEADADWALGEVVYDYCGLNDGGDYYNGSDESGTYLELTPESAAQLQNAVAVADSAWGGYRQGVANALASINLNVSDETLVQEIDAWLCRNCTYVLVDNAYMPYFTSTGQGQCYQYAKMFADMCNSAGIPAWKVEGGNHAWAEYQIGSQVYSIDPTSDDLNGLYG